MSLRHTLLGILDWTPAHGYLLRDLARGYSWLYPMSNTNIYPTLRSLESEGFVTHKEEVRDGRLRKVYAITDSGRAELVRWLEDPTPQSGTYRDPTLLKLCMLRSGALGGARTWIVHEIAQCEEAAMNTRKLLDAAVLPKYTRMVAQYGLELAEVRGRWLSRVLREIEGDEQGEASPEA